ncbi:MAG TPA: type II and III secretion system protein family protein [Rhizomicrobium sp.]|nr:type II and III secretion system protein family protein [Rhizomicrobium sp.]
MRKGIIAGVLAAATCVTGVATAATHKPAPAKAAQPPVKAKVVSIATHPGATINEHMNLALNKAAIVELDADARDVLVSNPTVVDAVVRTPRRIFLMGQKIGETNAFFFDEAGHQILSIDIHVQRDVSELQAALHNDMPDSDARAEGLNDSVVLTGTVNNSQEAARAADMAGRFVGDPTKVVNMLKVSANEQVLIKVRVAEVQRNIAKQLGVNLAQAAIVNGVPLVAATNNPFGLLGRALNDLSGGQAGQVCTSGANPLAGGECIIHPNNLQGSFTALEEVGLAHTLAEPNLTAVSGETAKFLAGGEFPVPTSRDQLGNVVVEFKQFGVGLSFTPVVLSENRIPLQISTEVSELTNEGAFLQGTSTITDSTTGTSTTVQGLTVPALAVRRAETTVELPSGGSFAIAGLLQHTTKQDLDRFPGLGQMPVLGALFRSRDFQNNETELVVIASAYLVNPTHESKLAAPTDGFVPAADADTIFLGRLNTVYKNNPGTMKAASADGQPGYIVQ